MPSPTRPAWRDASGRFSRGNPGRPKGALNRRKKITRLFAEDLMRHHGRYLEFIRDHTRRAT